MATQTTWLRNSREKQRVRPRNLPARRMRRRLLLGALSVGLFSSLVGGAIYGVKQHAEASPTFQVKNVVVSGVNVLREEAVLQAANITMEDNLLLTEPEHIAENVKKLAYVKDCTVRRAYPDRLVIHLTERTAGATLLVDQRLYEIDAEGVVLRELQGAEEHVQPLISNVPGIGVLAAGQKLDHPVLMQALRLWDAWRAQKISEVLTLSEISAESETTLRMFFDELPFELRWGRSDFSVQAQRLQALWDQKGGILPCQEYLDLRFDTDLACK